MIEVQQTAQFKAWYAGLRDKNAVHRIAIRMTRLEAGLFGDIKPVGDGVSELRVDYGPGYRLYIAQRGKTLVILLCGGDKSSQARDIAIAKQLATEL